MVVISRFQQGNKCISVEHTYGALKIKERRYNTLDSGLIDSGIQYTCIYR